MLNTLKKILEQEKKDQEKKKKQSDRDYYFEKEWEFLIAQKERKNKGVKND
tara:strand:- start:151 stop:303 length:153 start_codon:yes stop_codon:yes gene_type:complete